MASSILPGTSEAEREIADWRDRLAASGDIGAEMLEELESRLRGAMDDLKDRGLDADEAFLVAERRLGRLDANGRDQARSAGDESRRGIAPVAAGAAERRRDLLATLGLAVGAGLLAKLPALFGLEPGTDAGGMVYARNAAFFCLPAVAWGIARARVRGQMPSPASAAPASAAPAGAAPAGASPVLMALAFSALAAVLALLVNLFPFSPDSQTEILACIHLPILLWLALLPLHAGSRWREAPRGMDFVRFTGESLIYGVLLFCGVAVLGVFVSILFNTVGMDTARFVGEWLMPVGLFAVPVAATRLALARREVVEAIAPLLARIFAPLFLIAMLAFITATAATGRDPFASREALIVFDLVLALVLALVLWSTAMRDPDARPGLADWIDFGLALLALAIDASLLAAMAGRVGAWGMSPNRVAALGENLVLMADLAGTAFLLGRHLFLRGRYGAVLRWQTAFLAVILAWAAIVCLAFPPLFGGI